MHTPKVKIFRRHLVRCAQETLAELRIRHELAVFLMFKNVSRYLVEWIEFHRLVGATRFYLYDNASTDNPGRILEPYVREGVVVLHHWPGFPIFPAAREHCTRTYGHEARWIAMLDDDEFLFPVKGQSVPKVLEHYHRYPAVAVHWAMFGSSGHRLSPEGLVLENYTRRNADLSPKIKSIMNPRRVVRHKSTHYGIYTGKQLAVNERHETVRLSASDREPTGQLLRINHYWSKSEEDYRLKLSRGSPDIWGVENPYDMQMFRASEIADNQIEDTQILRFLPGLKERMRKRS